MRKHKYAKVIADIQMLLTALEYIDGQYRVVRLHLKKWREEQGLSLKTLSSKTHPHYAPESINQIEEGRFHPSPEFLSAMVKLIDQSDKQPEATHTAPPKAKSDRPKRSSGKR